MKRIKNIDLPAGDPLHYAVSLLRSVRAAMAVATAIHTLLTLGGEVELHCFSC